MGRVKDLSKGWDSNFLTELLSDPRKLGEKIRGRRGKGVSNVDFFFFFRWNAKPNFDETWTEISRGDEAWSKLSILKRNVSKVRTDLQRKSRWISVGFLPVFHIPILSLSKILYIYTSFHRFIRVVGSIRLNLDRIFFHLSTSFPRWEKGKKKVALFNSKIAQKLCTRFEQEGVIFRKKFLNLT